MQITLPQAFDAAVRGQTLVKLVLSAPQADVSETAERPPTRFTIRSVQLKGRLQLQWTARIGSKETHENLTLKESLVRLDGIFPLTYREANLLTTEADAQFRSRNGKTVQARQKSNQRVAPPVSHNRTKNYLIPEGQPCSFLEAIDVMTPDGRVKASMTHKFHQINRFLELVNDILPHLPTEGPLRVVDFGSGKSYLTFALHHLLVRVHHREVEILAIDQNAEVIETCRGLCERLQLSGIEFAAQLIASVAQCGPVHLAVALHACDGATDQALAQAVLWKSDVILAVPCCQHEVAKSIESAPLELLLRHGILKERFSALATDALRAAALDTAGYKTQILEFIDLDHTPKNLLIRAVKRREGEASATTSTAYADLKAHLGLGAITTDQIPNAGSP